MGPWNSNFNVIGASREKKKKEEKRKTGFDCVYWSSLSIDKGGVGVNRLLTVTVSQSLF